MSAGSVAGAPFLADPALLAVLDALERDGDRAMVVGGAVRNTLLGEAVTDTDVATTARPQTVMTRASAAGLKAVPTGVEHGTVTVVSAGRPFEVTTLRADVETDGRRAVVAFTDDWGLDASRRDFTMNAIYSDRMGTLFDPTGGVADARARRVRFIGRPEDRIREDYLRILRFFRFHARYGSGSPDGAGLAACVALQDGLDRLSRERVGQEMRKLVVAPGADATLALMHATGILDRVLGGRAHADRFHRLRGAGETPGPELALAIVGAEAGEDVERIAERLRLANAERERMTRIVAVSSSLGADPDEAAVRRAVYFEGNLVVADALLHAAARAGVPSSRHLAVARTWTAPRFPVTGKDLIARGAAPGPELGRRLRALEDRWIEDGFGAVPDY